MQIVVTNELNSKNHESLKVLSKNANTDDIHRFTRFAQSFTEPGDKEKADAVLQVSVAANRKNYDKVRRTSDMCEALRELMKEEIEEELKKSRDKAIQEGLAQGLEQGLEQGIEQGIEQGRINQLIDLVMQNLLPIETAAQCAKMTLDEFKVAIEKKEN
jgi:flagellar biosynthesis/type III secretory pathway protein FliH